MTEQDHQPARKKPHLDSKNRQNKAIFRNLTNRQSLDILHGYMNNDLPLHDIKNVIANIRNGKQTTQHPNKIPEQTPKKTIISIFRQRNPEKQ